MISFDPISDEQLAELKDKHGDDMREVEDGDRTFILVKPERPRGHLDRMAATAGNDKKKLEASETLVKACVVHPDKDTMKAVLADEPGLAFALGEHAMELLGVRQLTAKK